MIDGERECGDCYDMMLDICVGGSENSGRMLEPKTV